MLEVADFIIYNFYTVRLDFHQFMWLLLLISFQITKMQWTMTLYLRSVLVVGAFRYNSSCRERSSFILSFNFEELMFNLPQLPVFV